MPQTEQSRQDIKDTLSGAIDSLTKLKNSGYIPFTSPHPSSSELLIRHCIENALTELGTALALHKTIYENH